MIDLFSATRPADDQVSRVVRIVLGGQEFVLPVLRIAGNRKWKASLDSRLTSFIDSLTESGDDMGAILIALSSQIDALLDLLISYDGTHVLPSREDIEELAYEDELVVAVREVWRAASPLVAAAVIEAMRDELTTNGSSPPTSSPATPTAGPRKPSRKT